MIIWLSVSWIYSLLSTIAIVKGIRGVNIALSLIQYHHEVQNHSGNMDGCISFTSIVLLTIHHWLLLISLQYSWHVGSSMVQHKTSKLVLISYMENSLEVCLTDLRSITCIVHECQLLLYRYLMHHPEVILACFYLFLLRNNYECRRTRGYPDSL